MFPPTDRPRVFFLPPGVDFAMGVVRGLETHLAKSAPEDWARLRLIANSGRMIVRLREALQAGPPRLLPRMSLVTDLAELGLGRLPVPEDPISNLRRRLDLARLLRQPGILTNPSSALDQASALASLFDEMDEEGVTLDQVRALDLSGEPAQWQISLRVLNAVGPFAIAQSAQNSGRARTEALVRSWQVSPPSEPMIILGSTGSRGTTSILMRAVSKLPNGAVILPGFDTNTPQSVWGQLASEPQEDHPQNRYAKLMQELNLEPEEVQPWHPATPAAAARNEVLSLALRPAPVTHHWLTDGPKLPPLRTALARISLLEARDQRQEADAIAIRLREAAESGRPAALISPDRMLTRRVSAALARWDIVPDDSAGSPLSQTAPGRLLRHVAGLAANGVTAQSLIALLKHPLVATGAEERGGHLLHTRALEMKLRRRGPPFPTPSDIEEWASEDATRQAWSAWLAPLIEDHAIRNLPSFCRWLQETAETLSAGPEADGSGELWKEAAGRAALKLLEDLAEDADDGDDFDASEAMQILNSLLAATPMNIENVTHPGIMIWGTLDARAQGAELVILGGLNEQTWPQLPAPDPWLNRAMRSELELRSPERQVGLSAHDFQQAAAAPEVWLTRATKSDDAETVPSRWLNRLSTVLEGLPTQSGPEALDDMLIRGRLYLDHADRLDVADRAEPAKRPSPKPPVAVRPKRLTVTEIKTLIRDPYAIYARHVLKLRELDPLVTEPDALLRGTVLHKVMQSLFSDGWPEDPEVARDALSKTAERVLNREVPWPAARAMWKARLMRVAEWFIETERDRRADGKFELAEASGEVSLDAIDFKLAGTADRIDVDDHARALIYDYKTGIPPSKREQAAFDKQLLLEAAMLERGAFDSVSADRVARAAYIGLGSNPKEIDAPLAETDVWAEFTKLILRMLSPEHGFTSRRAMQTEAEEGRYDHLARFGEWTAADDPSEIDL